MDLTIGMKGTASTLVERSDTALEVGSGDLLVYATPCMAALMEGAACEAIAPALEEGQTSVGIALDLALRSYASQLACARILDILQSSGPAEQKKSRK